MLKPIQANTAAPNFTAKLKENDDLKNLVNKMNMKEKMQYGLAVAKLHTTHVGETLELRSDKDKNGIPLMSWSIVNTKDDKKQYYVGDVFDTRRNRISGDRIGPSTFIETLKRIATEGEFPHYMVFHDSNTSVKNNNEGKNHKKNVVDAIA